MGLANPWALGWAALLAVLVWLYLLEQRRQRVVVPSFLVWQQVHDERLTAARFRPDWLFWLQLLTLLLLITGLARPYRVVQATPSGMRHILVLDTTASMQAREDATSRFETARYEALQYLEGLPDVDEVMLVEAGHTASVLVNWTRNTTTVREALERATPIDAGGDLANAVAFADGARQRSEKPADVLVFTDMPASSLPSHLRQNVSVFQSGSSDDNVAIESMELTQGRFQGPEGARVTVQVHNFSAREMHGLVSVQLENSVVARHGVSLGAKESKRFQVSGFTRSGRVTASLEPADALTLDNVAYGWVHSVRAMRVLLVSNPTTLATELRSLAPAARLQLTVVAPTAYTEEAARAADIVIFHRWAPKAPPAESTLYIFPPTQGSPFSSHGEEAGLELLDWNAEHAAMRGLQLLLDRPLQRVRVVEPPPGSEILLRSRSTTREVALVFAHESAAQRLACLSFDLEAEQMLRTDNTSFLLLFLSLLDWLAPQADDVIVVRTGEAVNLGFAGAAKLVDPRGQEQDIQASDASGTSDNSGTSGTAGTSGTSLIEPLLAGVHELRTASSKRTLLATFADARESDIGRTMEPTGRVQAAQAASLVTAAAPPADSFEMWLWLAAAVLLLVEWWFATRRVAGQVTAAAPRRAVE